MKTLACGTKQLKTVIAKENLKKPKQTQKKTSEQIVFVGLWVWYFPGISESDSSSWNFKMLIGGGRYTMMAICLSPWNLQKDESSWMMVRTVG